MACIIRIQNYNQEPPKDYFLENNQNQDNPDISIQTSTDQTHVKIKIKTLSLQLRKNGYLENHFEPDFYLDHKTNKAIFSTEKYSMLIEHTSSNPNDPNSL